MAKTGVNRSLESQACGTPGRNEIHVGVDALEAKTRLRLLLDRTGHLVQLVMTEARAHLLHKRLKDHGAGIFTLYSRCPKPMILRLAAIASSR